MCEEPAQHDAHESTKPHYFICEGTQTPPINRNTRQVSLNKSQRQSSAQNKIERNCTMKDKQMTNKGRFLASANAIILLVLSICFVMQVFDQVNNASTSRVVL